MIDETPHVERARAAAAIVAPLAPRIEPERRLPAEVVDALVRAGVFKLLVPRALGGAEASVPTLLAVLEELARADGAAGWCAMMGASSGLMALLDETARAVYAPADAITCGVFAPMGRARRVDGGFRVSGRWPFASGCQHSQWVMGGAVVEGEWSDRAPPERRARRTKHPAPQGRDRMLDTWDTSGLRGTGSHDLEVPDVFVPRGGLLAPGRHTGAWRLPLPFFGVLAAGVAAVALGIGRAASTRSSPSPTKPPPGQANARAPRPRTAGRRPGRGAAARTRAFLYEAIEEATAAPSLVRGRACGSPLRMRPRSRPP